WQEELGLSLRTAEELHQQGFIEESEIPRYRELLSRYKFLLPRHYAALIDREDPGCPIRRQAIPSLRELAGGGKVDPLTDLAHRPSARVTHRSRNRVLLHPTPNCSMYCRYCFRKTLLNEAAEDLFAGGLR